ncbi:MAG: aldo/keto reductase [Chloroflexi bacterium]|nr:aldo/keto reductase [Chloroflexota bacterium]
MKYRDFGSTGLKISEIVFGAGAVGGLVFRPDRRTRLNAVRRALELGINWIDTAPSYGDGQSEENLGWILQDLGAQPHVSTKVRVGAEHLDDIPGEIARSMEASLKRLRRDSVDLIQLHTAVIRQRGGLRGSISIDDVLGENGVLAGFERLRQRGLVRFFGFTGFGDTDCLHRMIRSGRFHSVQAYYNMLNPSAGRSVPEGFAAHDYKDLIGLAAQNRVGVLNIRVLAAGAIVGRQPPGPREGLSPGSDAAADMERGARLREAIGDEAGEVAQAAIRFGLMNPNISGVLVGFSKLEHVDDAARAADMGPLPDSVLEKLDELYQIDFGRKA